MTGEDKDGLGQICAGRLHFVFAARRHTRAYRVCTYIVGMCSKTYNGILIFLTTIPIIFYYILCHFIVCLLPSLIKLQLCDILISSVV